MIIFRKYLTLSYVRSVSQSILLKNIQYRLIYAVSHPLKPIAISAKLTNQPT